MVPGTRWCPGQENDRYRPKKVVVNRLPAKNNAAEKRGEQSSARQVQLTCHPPRGISPLVYDIDGSGVLSLVCSVWRAQSPFSKIRPSKKQIVSTLSKIMTCGSRGLQKPTVNLDDGRREEEHGDDGTFFYSLLEAHRKHTSGSFLENGGPWRDQCGGWRGQ